MGTTSKDSTNLEIFKLWLAESSDAEPVDTEGQLY